MVDGNEIEASVFAIDVGDELADHTLQLGRVGKGRAGDLDHDDIANPLGVVLQQLFECTKLEGC